MNIIGLLRHGPTIWNRSKQLQGIRDIPLDTAAFQIEPWQKLLRQYGPWDHIVTSTLSRCIETCHLLLPGQAHDLDHDLREQDWGQWTGQTLKLIGAESPGSIEAQEQRGWDFTPPGGENRREVLSRVQAAIRKATDNRDGERILFITHLGVIQILLNHLQNTLFLPNHSTPVVKRGLHLLGEDAGHLSILKINIESQ